VKGNRGEVKVRNEKENDTRKMAHFSIIMINIQGLGVLN
jgi:hypothetical protein